MRTLSVSQYPLRDGRLRLQMPHLGHATVSISRDTYSHAIPALQEEAAERIAGLVLAGG